MEEIEYPIGKYEILRKSYLQEHRKGLYLELALAGKLNEHLHQIDEKCDQMMEQMKKAGSDVRTEDAGSDGMG